MNNCLKLCSWLGGVVVASSMAVLTSGAAQASDKASHDDELQGKVPFLTSTAQNLDLADSPIHPFINSALPNPPAEVYSGPLFQLRHDYPSQVPSGQTYPWKQVTNNGLITPQNSMAYVEALKDYVSDDMRKLLYSYDQWDPQSEPWWQSIWLGTEREPIHGFYVGSGFPAGTMPEQTLDRKSVV